MNQSGRRWLGFATTRASEQVADRLRASILEGDFGPGELLPPERTLAERFRVTRNTIREALRQLEQLRMVVIRQGSGVRVQDYLTTAGIEMMVFLLLAEGPRSALMRDVLEARSVIGEAICGAALAQFPDAPDAIARFAAAARAFEAEARRPRPDVRALQQLEFELHHTLMREAGNRAFVLLYNSLHHVYDRVAHLFEPLLATDPRGLADHYREAADALTRGDRPAAQRAFRAVFAAGRPAEEDNHDAR